VRGGKEEVVTLTLGEMPKERQANAGTQDRETNGADVPKLGLAGARQLWSPVRPVKAWW
jgi:hypothetical protein